MKQAKLYPITALLCIVAWQAGAQTGNAGIGTTTPDGTAQLDVSSTTKGMLIPRMTAVQRAAIVNPATGLQVYQTDGTPGLCYFDGANWISLIGNSVAANGFVPSLQYSSVPIITFSGSGNAGNADGTGITASFNHPTQMALDASRNLYVSDLQNNRIRIITSMGVVTTLMDSSTGTAAIFSSPSGIDLDAAGNLYVVEGGARRIRKVTPAGGISTFAGSGATGNLDGTGINASFTAPFDLVIDASDNLYVTDQSSNKIRKISPAGVVSTLVANTLSQSAGITIDASGNLYVAQPFANRIIKVTPTGTLSTFAGSGFSGSADGIGTAASFHTPLDVITDGSGNLYVADGGNNKIRKISPTGLVSTVAGSGVAGSADGAGILATFKNPAGLAMDPTGYLYISDNGNSKIRRAFIPVFAMLTSQSGIPADNILPGGSLPVLNGNALTNLNAANLVGTLPSLNASTFTNLNASNLSSGFVDSARLSYVSSSRLCGALPALDGSALTNLNIANLTGTTLPALDGNALTNLNAASLTGTLPALDGSALTGLDATKLTGSYLPALDASFLTSLNASNISFGYIDSARLSIIPAGRLHGALPALNGNALTNINAAGLIGAIPGSALPDNATKNFNMNSTYNLLVRTGQGIGWYGYPAKPFGSNTSITDATVVYGFSQGALASSSNSNIALSWNNAGKVGINNVVNPRQTLDVDGGILARANSPIGNQGAYLQWNRTVGEGETWIINQRGGGNANAGIRFGKSDTSNNVIEWARFMDNGSLGIGTTIPTALLSVNGTADKQGGGTWGTFSDARVKKNVQDYRAGLKEILAIHPVSFEYNQLSGYTDTTKRFVGVIAQEIEKVLPATVTIVNSDPKVQDKRQYDGSELVYALINAVKEQQKQIEDLKKQNSSQQAAIDEDHASLLSLQQELDLMRTGKTAQR